MKCRVWLSCFLLLCTLTGCIQPYAGTDHNSVGGDRDTLGLTPDFSYEVMEQTPNILVNQIGYLTENKKVAILQGNNLENVFYIYNAYTNELKYEGLLTSDSLGVSEEAEASETQETEVIKDIYLADFSNVKEPGTYYVYHPDLGYSYEFRIGDNIYDEAEKIALTVLDTED